MLIGKGQADRTLSDSEMREIIAEAARAMSPAGKRVLAIVPDATRTCPLGAVARCLHEALAGQGAALDFLIALGTHRLMEPEQIDRLFDVSPGQWQQVFGRSQVFNHEWQDPAALRHVGALTEADVALITDGEFRMKVGVVVNRRIFEYDRVLIVGPVFPHEVVGFSGGNKYFFPGICGEELLNFFHWLGAVITSPRIIGTKDTPVRRTIDHAAGMLDVEKYALCLVVGAGGVHGMYFGEPEEAWSPAADLSARVHIVRVNRPFQSILAAAPGMYDDIWTAGKCMYKMECVVDDGGELVIYAPHITEVSYTHGRVIDQVGYHTRDYFLAQWDRFKHYPWGVLAHSTHVCGIGAYENGQDRPRIRVTLATGIGEARCRRINLGYRDPASINVSDWQEKEDQGRLYVPRAGETLYKLRNPPSWQVFPRRRR